MKRFNVSLIALAACGLIAMSAPADAACTASERAQIEQRLVGKWKYYLKGGEMCYGMVFGAKGAFTDFQKNCNGSRDETSHGRWSMDAECKVQIVFKKAKGNFFNQRSRSETLTITFRDRNQFTTAEDGIGGYFRRQ